MDRTYTKEEVLNLMTDVYSYYKDYEAIFTDHWEVNEINTKTKVIEVLSEFITTVWIDSTDKFKETYYSNCSDWPSPEYCAKRIDECIYSFMC